MSTTSKTNNSKTKEKIKLIPITIRLPESDYKSIYELATEYHTNFSDVIRLSIKGDLEKYFGSLRFIDPNQGERIEKDLNDLSYTCRNILNNVRRIGVNYNQEIKLKNAENKYREVLKTSGIGSNAIYDAMNELEAARKEIKATCLDKDELENLLSRFENAAKKVEETIWPFRP